ncbi:MAG: carbamoyl-phosphate synthase large subunit [Candidatus Omnitrophica bacterium]|nr:carbamoyl-phosphate synthase large subunit [Candidatus Omnitrophota bacterium]MCG2703481.1 carbamoyl-phosphate synthase large subunit [Candidatus Omnitrophota bacterium]
MPKRTDIKKILIIGSGPIVIGQACEFDYSGTQACKALKEEGFEVVLINSNPATIMTDPELADATYIEPITPEVLEKIIEKERPDALLPTMGGQTGLNMAMKIAANGVLDKYNVKMIGANTEAIRKAEDRKCFKEAMQKIGLDLPRSALAYDMEEALKVLEEIKLPVIIRPSFTLGGTGGGIANTEAEFEKVAALGLRNSMISEILIEESILGWKEYELEVMRDLKDNVVIVCSIENFDPMGIHTGDSITVAPAQTLTDREYQKMRDASLAIIREIGVETGGSNIQFAVNPENGRMVVIEMNPRVSRSSALASKATGFPIAKFAAKLAVGYTLDEIRNDITKETPASFEPTIDYCVVKIPRFTFEKFPEAQDILGISMKSVGETMAIGRTFKEALQKGLRGLEIGHNGLDNKRNYTEIDEEKIMQRLKEPNASRIFYIKYALQKGMSIEEISAITRIDIWFLKNMEDILLLEKEISRCKARRGKKKKNNSGLEEELLLQAKQYGFSDLQIARLAGMEEGQVRALRKKKGILPTYKLVDTCAAEFEAYTPYYYSTYETEDETRVSAKKKIMILGGGPNRIGQGIEFDYCCCHAAFALKELGYETIMVNSNPETVSTDYDTSDKLYFEPLTFEDVMNIVDREKPDGLIVQFGGQTPLNLAKRLAKAGAPIIGTSVESIDRAEDRNKFSKLVKKLGINQPPNGSATCREEAIEIAKKIGYPILVRPSYVLGGRAMRIVYNDRELKKFMKEAVAASSESPILIDKFLEDAVEVDVDALSDGKTTVIGGIMEHIEEAGVHSGDSACVLPPHTLSDDIIVTIKELTLAISKELKVKGLLNIQFAVKNDIVYVLEVNPRASRTVPFLSKATGIPLAKIAAKVMTGKTLAELGIIKEKEISHVCVKESVLPFSRFSGVDIILGPEMKSTGEVMGIDTNFGVAFYKSQLAAGTVLPKQGKIFISVKNDDKRSIVFVAKKLFDMGFELIATKGTHKVFKSNDIKAALVGKIAEGNTEILEMIKKGEIKLIINTPSGRTGQSDMKPIRSLAVMNGIPCITTIQGAQAAVNGIESVLKSDFSVTPIQEYLKNNQENAGKKMRLI